jgi:hypothetical protein
MHNFKKVQYFVINVNVNVNIKTVVEVTMRITLCILNLYK